MTEQCLQGASLVACWPKDSEEGKLLRANSRVAWTHTRLKPTMFAGVLAALTIVLATMTAAKAQTAGGQKEAYVDVGVATLWVGPGYDQPVDKPAVSNPSDIELWLQNMSLGQQTRLVGDLETQALYGHKVKILEEKAEWVKVAVPGQLTPRNREGYPGWVPKRQLTYDTSMDSYQGRPFAQVESRNAWLYKSEKVDSDSRFIKVSYATRLPVLQREANAIEVATPDDGNKWLKVGDVSVYSKESAIPHPTGQQLVESAKKFLGVPYLWAGTSGFGFDCSGFTYTVHRAHGITIPRDTVSQEELRDPSYGKPVRNYADLQPGDLAYFAYKNGTGAVHHVGMYIGDGKMIQAFDIGSDVNIVSIEGTDLGKEFAGGIRYY
jgi:cell wall-associated NlpC family hydrolase